MRIALCDDEPATAQVFAELIRSWSGLRDCPCEITAFSSAKALLFEAQGSFAFDLILLDIEMPGMNGMDLAKEIRRLDGEVPIAFLTNYQDFVFEGYEVGAFRYILKTQAEEKLFPMLDEVQKKLEQTKNYLLVKAQGEDIRLDLNGIMYLEAQKHDTAVHMGEKTFMLRQPISGLAGLLGEGFAAAHRSYIVNLDYVERLSRTECRMTNGECVPVSRGAYARLNEAFISHYKAARGLG